MKKKDWPYLILGIFVNIYGWIVMVGLILGITIAASKGKTISLAFSDNTIQSILMAVLLIICGKYLIDNSIDKNYNETEH